MFQHEEMYKIDILSKRLPLKIKNQFDRINKNAINENSMKIT